MISEYMQDIRHLAGEKNAAADALSRLGMTDDVGECHEVLYARKEYQNDSIFPLDLERISKVQEQDKEIQEIGAIVTHFMIRGSKVVTVKRESWCQRR